MNKMDKMKRIIFPHLVRKSFWLPLLHFFIIKINKYIQNLGTIS